MSADLTGAADAARQAGDRRPSERGVRLRTHQRRALEALDAAWAAGRRRSLREVARIGAGEQLVADGVVWHAVPAALGTRAQSARRFARAWDHWVGGGEPVYTGSPEGAGVLAAQRGSDPFDVTTVIRRQWS